MLGDGGIEFGSFVALVNIVLDFCLNIVLLLFTIFVNRMCSRHCGMFLKHKNKLNFLEVLNYIGIIQRPTR